MFNGQCSRVQWSMVNVREFNGQWSMFESSMFESSMVNGQCSILIYADTKRDSAVSLIKLILE